MMQDFPPSMVVTLPPAAPLFRQGELSRDVFYWIAGGSVRLLVDDKPVREIAFDPGARHFFGDLAAILGRPRSSTVESVTENSFVRIPYEPETLDQFLRITPNVAQHWLVSLANTAYDSIAALKTKQQPLDAVREHLKKLERQDLANRKKWSGILFVSEKAHSRVKHPSAGGILRYLQRLKFFNQEEGKATDVDSKLLSADLKNVFY